MSWSSMCLSLKLFLNLRLMQLPCRLRRLDLRLNHRPLVGLLVQLLCSLRRLDLKLDLRRFDFRSMPVWPASTPSQVRRTVGLKLWCVKKKGNKGPKKMHNFSGDQDNQKWSELQRKTWPSHGPGENFGASSFNVPKSEFCVCPKMRIGSVSLFHCFTQVAGLVQQKKRKLQPRTSPVSQSPTTPSPTPRATQAFSQQLWSRDFQSRVGPWQTLF